MGEKKKSKTSKASKSKRKTPKSTSNRKNLTTTKFSSYLVGEFPTSCQLSAEGKNLNLFVTGLSNRIHPYESNDPRQEKDFVYANELKVQNKKDVVAEVKNSLAEGVALTGGDPLTRMDRTTGYIKLLKNEFGDSFHINLFTFLDSLTDLKLARLADVKLDELILYPDIDNPRSWRKLKMARKYNWKIALVLPVLSHKVDHLKRMINAVHDNIDWIIFQESSPTSELRKIALNLMRHCGKCSLSAYYFPPKKKQMIELRNRLKLRASHLAKPFDKVTRSGTLIRGALYLPSLLPSEDYNLKLQTIKRNEYLKRLYRLKRELNSLLKAEFGTIEVDRDRMRILTKADVVRKSVKKVKKLNLVPALVEEYPTSDVVQVELKFL